MSKSGLFQECEIGLTFEIQIIYYIETKRRKHHMIILIDTEKTLGKIQLDKAYLQKFYSYSKV